MVQKGGNYQACGGAEWWSRNSGLQVFGLGCMGSKFDRLLRFLQPKETESTSQRSHAG